MKDMINWHIKLCDELKKTNSNKLKVMDVSWKIKL